MIQDKEVFPIGHISKVRGIKGEVEMQFTDDVFDRGTADYFVLSLDGILVPFFWEEYRFKNNGTIVLKLEGCNNEREAKRMVGTKVFYPFSAIPTDEANTLPSIQALKGFQVKDANGLAIGHIENVDDRNINILLYLRTPQEEEVVVPYHDDFLVDFDLQQRSITLDLPEGILDINR